MGPLQILKATAVGDHIALVFLERGGEPGMAGGSWIGDK